MHKKFYILGGLVIGALVLVGAGCLKGNKDSYKPPLSSSADIQVFDQNLGSDNAVNFSKLVAPEDGWISVHAVDDEGRTGDVLGLTQINKGELKNVKVVINDKKRLTPNLATMLHYDKGEKGIFEPDKDGPVIIDSVVIMRKFTILNFADVKP